MSRTRSRLDVAGREFVLVPAAEYRRLRRLAEGGYVDAIRYANLSIGRDLARVRRRARLSQVQVAARARVRVETVSRIENGRGHPTGATVRKILRALGGRRR